MHNGEVTAENSYQNLHVKQADNVFSQIIDKYLLSLPLPQCPPVIQG